MASRKAIARRLLFAAYAVLASALLAEAALRVVSTLPGSTPYFVSDPVVGFRPRPGLEVEGAPNNRGGFNDVDHPPAKAPGTRRIAFVGDSFVFGAGRREEGVVAVFDRLARERGLPWEVLNLGIPGAGPDNYLGVVRNDATAAGIDLVVLVFFVGNDVTQSHPDFVTRVWFGGPRLVLRSPWLVRLSPDAFYTVKLLRTGGRLVRERWSRRRDGAAGTYDRRTFLAIELDRLELMRREPSPFVAASYAGVAPRLAAIRDATTAAGGRLVVVLAADQVQTDRELQVELVGARGVDLADYDLDRPQRFLTAVLAELGVPTLDLLEPFRRHGPEPPLYFPLDTHWNRPGNELAAREILDFVAASG